LHVPRACPGAAAVVYGIAHAGAGAAPWNAVAAAAPPTIEIRAVRLPGRESRISVPWHSGVDAAAEEVAQVIGADAAEHRLSFLVAGSCSGVLLGLAALARLPDPTLPVVGLLGLRPPTADQVALTAGSGVTAMSAEALRSWLRDNRLTPTPVLDNDKLYQFFEPTLRRDLAMIDGYRYRGEPLSCPVFLVRTRESAPAVEASWRQQTTGPVHHVDLDVAGDPLTEHPEVLGEVLGRLVAPARCAERTWPR
jgi:medium-chain acyl-[acyl-carrier-protein] hydrolase